MDKKTYIIMNIIRVAIVAFMFYWGIQQWKAFPEEIPVVFNTAGKAAENGTKSMFIPIFFFLGAALIPMRATVTDNEEEQTEEKRKALLFSFMHTVLMCLIFLWRINLVKNNLV